MSLIDVINDSSVVHFPSVLTIGFSPEQDPSYVKTPMELFRQRKYIILKNLNLEKLENSSIKSVKNKNFSYSQKELIKITIDLGLNSNSLKSVLIDKLIKIKKDFNKNIW